MAGRPLPFPERGRIGIVGDWGTGLYGAPLIARRDAERPDPFDLLLHLGDVYYSGTKKRAGELPRYLAEAAERDPRAFNSNHEMYSGGECFFKETLPAFGQDASCCAIENDRWMLVGLDVAYTDHEIDDEQVAWLKRSSSIRPAIERSSSSRITSCTRIFDTQGQKLRAHPGFAVILNSRRIFAWYWGHEHRCAIYQKRETRRDSRPDASVTAACRRAEPRRESPGGERHRPRRLAAGAGALGRGRRQRRAAERSYSKDRTR